jgi:AcrR family transcriptional regulator
MSSAAGSPAQAERERVHAALIELCYEHGFVNLTIADLCRRAAVDAAFFERNYADLEDCFCQAFILERDRFYAAREAACAGLSGWRNRLRASAYALQRIIGPDPKLAHFVIVEPRAAGERPQLLIEGVIERMLELLDQGRDRQDGPEPISRASAESIAGGIFLRIYAAVLNGSPELSEQKVREMLHAAVLPYLGADAAEEELLIPAPST